MGKYNYGSISEVIKQREIPRLELRKMIAAIKQKPLNRLQENEISNCIFWLEKYLGPVAEADNGTIMLLNSDAYKNCEQKIEKEKRGGINGRRNDMAEVST